MHRIRSGSAATNPRCTFRAAERRLRSRAFERARLRILSVPATRSSRRHNRSTRRVDAAAGAECVRCLVDAGCGKRRRERWALAEEMLERVHRVADVDDAAVVRVRRVETVCPTATAATASSTPCPRYRGLRSSRRRSTPRATPGWPTATATVLQPSTSALSRCRRPRSREHRETGDDCKIAVILRRGAPSIRSFDSRRLRTQPHLRRRLTLDPPASGPPTCGGSFESVHTADDAARASHADVALERRPGHRQPAAAVCQVLPIAALSAA